MKIFTETKNNHFEFELSDSNGESFLKAHGKKLNISFQKKNMNSFLLTRDKQTYNITVTKNEKGFDILVNGIPFQVTVLDEHTKKMQEVIKSGHTGHAEKTLKAQIPGLIVDVLVEQGDELKAGQPLLILEAMKMENVIKAPFDCQVIQVMVQTKETVNQDQALLKIKSL